MAVQCHVCKVSISVDAKECPTCGSDQSNYSKYVGGQTAGKSLVISVHLWLEYLLIECVRAVVPDPEPLFRDRGVGFLQLVSLCEAHRVIERPVADLLRRANSLRNKCAHQLTFNPKDEDWQYFKTAVDSVAPAVDVRTDGSGDYDEGLRRLADLLERRAVAIGANSRPVR